MQIKNLTLRLVKRVLGDNRYMWLRRATIRGLKLVRLKPVPHSVQNSVQTPAAKVTKPAPQPSTQPVPQPNKEKPSLVAAIAQASRSIASPGIKDDFDFVTALGVEYDYQKPDFATTCERIVDNGLTIITLNLNGAQMLDDYMRGLNHLPAIPVQLVFVDHNSSDNSVEIVERHAQNLNLEVTLLRKKVNDSYSKSNNDALKLAKHDNILLLNNDVILTDHTQIYSSLELLEADSSIGAIGWDLYFDEARQKPQHQGISFLWDKDVGFYRPKNIAGVRPAVTHGTVRVFPAITAALALFRRSDLVAIDGFDENYLYGFEDVDLCLSLLTKIGKKSVLIEGSSAIHNESTSQKKDSRLAVSKRRQANAIHFREQYGAFVKQRAREHFLVKGNPYNLKKLSIGFVVTEAFAGATAGDYFTALEMAIALERHLNCQITFFAQRGPGVQKHPDCAGLDAVIVLIDRFDIRNLKNRTSETMVIAWMRNWFDRWASWAYFSHYDYYYTSSDKAQSYMHDELGINSDVVRIGTNFSRFYTPVNNIDRPIDIVFVGSRWNVKRDIEDTFPVLANYNSKIYGHGWSSDNADYQNMFEGSIDYAQVPSIYAKAKIVIDDAASSTIHWSSVNSRVYDALAAGCLVITNGCSGAKELRSLSAGAMQLQTFESTAELEQILQTYLSDERLRIAECAKLQTTVRLHHSYQHRAATLVNSLQAKVRGAYRIAIKIPVPDETVKQQWGDYHFAQSLKLALQYHGHQVRIDLMPDWYCAQANADDVVIVLRGLSEYKPNPSQINLIWNISHPVKVSDEEFAQYDTVFVASNSYAKTLSERLPDTPVLALLQCTDPYRFFQDQDPEVAEHELLFVGNSRRVYRDVVKFSIEKQYPISIYGALWEGLIPKEYVQGDNIANTDLRKYYSNASIVLNDHWDTMRDNGFLSNRLFDAVACGALVVSDHVDGIAEIFGDAVITFDGSVDGFAMAIESAKTRVINDTAAQNIHQHHSFQARAKVILEQIEQHVKNANSQTHH